MKIVMITNHGCIRVFKMLMPLVAKGHEVHLITQKVTQYSDFASSLTTYHQLDQMVEAIRKFEDADVFHVHNEPSWAVTAVKEVFWSKPVVLDIHDSLLLRRTDKEVEEAEDPEVFRISVDERNNFQLADGIVYVCEPMKKIVSSTFTLDQPNIVLPSFLPERFYRLDFLKWVGGLVYEGRIDTPDELEARWNFFQYANYINFAKACRHLGIDFHVYTPRKNDSVREQYGDICFLYPPQNVQRLIKYLGSHDWGLVGNLKPYEEWKHALPNKLFEYMAGCVPIVCMHADESWNFIKDYGVGIKVDNPKELTERWAEHEQCRKNVIRYRGEFVMERHIKKLEDLYHGLLG